MAASTMLSYIGDSWFQFLFSWLFFFQNELVEHLFNARGL